MRLTCQKLLLPISVCHLFLSLALSLSISCSLSLSPFLLSFFLAEAGGRKPEDKPSVSGKCGVI